MIPLLGSLYKLDHNDAPKPSSFIKGARVGGGGGGLWVTGPMRCAQSSVSCKGGFITRTLIVVLKEATTITGLCEADLRDVEGGGWNGLGFEV